MLIEKARCYLCVQCLTSIGLRLCKHHCKGMGGRCCIGQNLIEGGVNMILGVGGKPLKKYMGRGEDVY